MEGHTSLPTPEHCRAAFWPPKDLQDPWAPQKRKDTPVFPSTTTHQELCCCLHQCFDSFPYSRSPSRSALPCELQAGAWLLFQPPVMGISPAHAADKLPLSLQTEDKEYDDLEEKFQCVASSVATLKENMASYLGHLEVTPWPHPLRSCSLGLGNTFKPCGKQELLGMFRDLQLSCCVRELHNTQGLLRSRGV